MLRQATQNLITALYPRYGKENRIELHEKLSLTGAEISLNELPAGANVPSERGINFFHIIHHLLFG